jgi:hypothetical protein
VYRRVSPSVRFGKHIQECSHALFATILLWNSRLCHNNDVFFFSSTSQRKHVRHRRPSQQGMQARYEPAFTARRPQVSFLPRQKSQRTCPCWLVGLGSGRMFLCAREHCCTSRVRDRSARDDVDCAHLRSSRAPARSFRDTPAPTVARARAPNSRASTPRPRTHGGRSLLDFACVRLRDCAWPSAKGSSASNSHEVVSTHYSSLTRKNERNPSTR